MSTEKCWVILSRCPCCHIVCCIQYFSQRSWCMADPNNKFQFWISWEFESIWAILSDCVLGMGGIYGSSGQRLKANSVEGFSLLDWTGSNAGDSASQGNYSVVAAVIMFCILYPLVLGITKIKPLFNSSFRKSVSYVMLLWRVVWNILFEFVDEQRLTRYL